MSPLKKKKKQPKNKHTKKSSAIEYLPGTAYILAWAFENW